MAQILIRGESVYKCDVCMRKLRVLTARDGIDVVQRCTITYGCKGRLHRVKNAEEANTTPAFPTEVAGVQDWFQRRVEYTHQQPILSKVWIIKHQLASRPTVYAYATRQTTASATVSATNIPAGSIWYKSASGIDKNNPYAPTAAGLYEYNGARWVRPKNIIEVGMQGNNVFEYMVLVKPHAVETIDNNTVRVSFLETCSGLAQCVASASQNTTNPVRAVGVDASAAFQLSHNGEITIATVNANPYITVAINFKSSTVSGGINVAFSGVDNTASVNSPWVGVDRIFVNGRTYTVRSFNLANLPPVPAIAASGNIDPTKARFTFEGMSGNINENMILLGNSPFATVDRIYDRFIDISTLGRFAPEIYYNAGEIYAAKQVIKPVYPLINTLNYSDVSTVV